MVEHHKRAKEEKNNTRKCIRKEIKVGVEEKKKTQGMRRDLGHKGCGPKPLFLFSFSHHFGWCAFLGGRKWMRRKIGRLVTVTIFAHLPNILLYYQFLTYFIYLVFSNIYCIAICLSNSTWRNIPLYCCCSTND